MGLQRALSSHTRRKSQLLKTTFWALCLAGLIYTGVRVYMHLTDDFRLANIRCELPCQLAWEIPALSPLQEEELNRILQQEFTYLGKGSQSYAFASADGSYVLKFFKFKHIRPSWIEEQLQAFTLFKGLGEKQRARKARKLWGVFHSHKLAYDLHREGSGLKFIQLNCTKNRSRKVSIKDKMGFKHTVQLNSLPFVLQQKAQPLTLALHLLLKERHVAAAKQRLAQVFDLYANEYAKGIYDRDHHVMRNVGFVENGALHMDVGKLVKEEKMQEKEYAREDALLVARSISAWLARHYPEHEALLSAYMEATITRLFAE
jgi:hypothetical protein